MHDRLAQWRQKTWCAPLELMRAQHRVLRIYTNIAGILPGFLEQVAADFSSLAQKYPHMLELVESVDSTKRLPSAALKGPEKLDFDHSLAACGLSEESIPATLHAAISSHNTGVVLYQLQGLSPGTIPRNEFAVCLVDLLDSFESRRTLELKETARAHDIFILRHLLRLGLSPHVYVDGDNKFWSVLLRKRSHQILDGGDDFAYLLLKSFLQQGASVQMLIDEGTMLQSLAPDRAQELCGLQSNAALKEQTRHVPSLQEDSVLISRSQLICKG